ncbi:MAG TPA: FHA domain-containing protein, partial [Thermoanaerobaculia bacterium]|nr:FHA domain-containing protein [Thermoanaerobaculia bacterium]
MLRLRYVLDGEDHVYSLTASKVRLGRGSDNDVVLSDVSVSRYHAELSLVGDIWYVQDLKSTNGVEVNRVPVQRAPLQPGDRLGIGIFDLQLERSESRDIRQSLPPMKEDTGPILTNATIVRPL